MTAAVQAGQQTDAGRLTPGFLDIDCAAAVEAICRRLVKTLTLDFRRRGMVVAVSGGVDSSVCAALAARALGPQRVQALLLPERESSNASESLGQLVVDHLGTPYIKHDIAPALEALSCYRWRDEAIRRVLPEYEPTWKSKLVLACHAAAGFHFFKLVVQDRHGRLIERRLPHKEYLQLVAAMNFKQRVRKAIEYFHADRLNYAVLGTPNRLEYDQGFFVKNGDGSADIKPIAHLYKTQVYALARYLGLPDPICSAVPTTDTYSLPQGQDEFYFGLPYQQMDAALWAYNQGVPARHLAHYLAIDLAQAERVYKDIEAKRRTTRYLHMPPVLVKEVPLPVVAGRDTYVGG